MLGPNQIGPEASQLRAHNTAQKTQYSPRKFLEGFPIDQFYDAVVELPLSEPILVRPKEEVQSVSVRSWKLPKLDNSALEATPMMATTWAASRELSFSQATSGITS